MAATDITFPRISTKLVMAGQWTSDPEWYRFFELLWKRTGGDTTDLVDDANASAASLLTAINAVKAYTITGTEILINGVTSRQLLNAPLALSLATTGVAAAAYGGVGKYVSFTVDAKGRLTLAGDGALDADDIPFDPTGSILTSTNVGDALRELAGLV